MPPLDIRDLTLFETVARHRSFRRAAAELQLSVSSLSERLRALEGELGVRLLNRTTRSVAPTEAGELLLARLSPALREVGAALAAVRDLAAVPSGRLRINAPAPAADLVLAPLIADFLAAHPAISIEVVIDPSLVDIVAQGFDAGVRYEEHLARDMIAVSLGAPQRYAIVVAPKLLAHLAMPRSPEDLLHLPCLATVFPSRATVPWEFEKDGRSITFTPRGPLAATSSRLLVRAALDGAGFLMTFEDYVRPALDAGDLVGVLEDWWPRFPGPFLYYPSRRQLPPALAAFVAFVRERRTRAAAANRSSNVNTEAPRTNA